MALIKWGMMVVDGRGKLGGHVLTKSRNGASVRTKVTPTNPQTSYQQANRAIFGQLSSNWTSLTEAQRQAWNGAVKEWEKTNIFGDLKAPAGRDLYISLNRNILQASGTEIVLPPTKQGIKPNHIVSVDFDAVNENIDITLFGTPDTNEVVLVYLTEPMSAGRYNFSGAYRFFTTDKTKSISIPYADYEARFGSLIDGKALGIQVVICNDQTGEKSPPMHERKLIGV